LEGVNDYARIINQISNTAGFHDDFYVLHRKRPNVHGPARNSGQRQENDFIPRGDGPGYGNFH
jgi:hypothetical protein